MTKQTPLSLILVLFFGLLVTACQPQVQQRKLVVSLIADGRGRNYEYTTPVTVDEFLRDANIQVGELDRLTPERYTQITDGMRVTIVRIQEEVYCENQTIPFRQRTVPNEALQPGEEYLGQAGQNGVEEVCFRVYIEDSVRRDPIRISSTILTNPQDEVVYVGPSGQLEPVSINGTLSYISNGNAWVMRGSSTTKRPLTASGDLDGRVYSLSADGRQLLFTRRTVQDSENTAFNKLWMIPSVSDTDPTLVGLVPENVLYADWVPAQESTISYSTGEPREAPPGWLALNDLWIMRLDAATGEALDVEELIERTNSGLYSWWGTGYEWSNSGQQLAWIRADSIGLVDLETGSLTPVLEYPAYNTRQSWSWLSTVSWSQDDSLLLATIHGQPIGNEPAETSPAFHVAAADVSGTFTASLVENAGIWSLPKYSPVLTQNGGQFPQGSIAYLRCVNFPNCFSDEAAYTLMLADRDGSNPRTLFPEASQPGMTERDFVWSPDGTQIACIYQGNLWVIDTTSGIAQQLTLDGGASKPVWTP